MKELYIDYTYGLSNKDHKYHGGGNYSKRILLILNSMEYLPCKVFILWRKGYKAQNKEEKIIKNTNKMTLLEVENNIEEYNFNNHSVVLSLIHI